MGEPMISKKERFFAALDALGGMVCPVCGADLRRSGDSLRCPAGHCLNVSRQGMVNTLSRPREEDYPPALFEARARVLASGLYEPVAAAVEALLPEGPQRILDAGCGEGWYLDRLLTAHPAWTGAGVDISAAAIRLATNHPCRAVWCVADLRRPPFADGTFTAVLDILTPAGYDAFARVLAPEGLLIKVYPGAGYLREIRRARGLLDYGEGLVEDWLRRSAEIAAERRVTETVPVSPELWRDLVRMTPLNRGLSEEDLDALAASPAGAITIDLHVTAARPARREMP